EENDETMAESDANIEPIQTTIESINDDAQQQQQLNQATAIEASEPRQAQIEDDEPILQPLPPKSPSTLQPLSETDDERVDEDIANDDGEGIFTTEELDENRSIF